MVPKNTHRFKKSMQLWASNDNLTSYGLLIVVVNFIFVRLLATNELLLASKHNRIIAYIIEKFYRNLYAACRWFYWYRWRLIIMNSPSVRKHLLHLVLIIIIKSAPKIFIKSDYLEILLNPFKITFMCLFFLYFIFLLKEIFFQCTLLPQT